MSIRSWLDDVRDPKRLPVGLCSPLSYRLRRIPLPSFVMVELVCIFVSVCI